MTRPIMPDDGAPRTRTVVDARQLWAGGVATAVVAALVALVGVVVCRWLFNIPLLSPKSQGTYGDAHTTTVVLVSAAAALVATGLLHLLLWEERADLLIMAVDRARWSTWSAADQAMVRAAAQEASRDSPGC